MESYSYSARLEISGIFVNDPRFIMSVKNFLANCSQSVISTFENDALMVTSEGSWQAFNTIIQLLGETSFYFEAVENTSIIVTLGVFYTFQCNMEFDLDVINVLKKTNAVLCVSCYKVD